MKFADFKVLTFDCYGTLIDWEAGLSRALQAWAQGHGLVVEDAALLEAFSRSEPHQEQGVGDLRGVFRPYPEVLRAVLGDIARDFDCPAPIQGETDAFTGSVGDWPAFPDTVAALKKLQRWHRLVVVSNVDRTSFARTQKLLGIAFDAVVTAEDVGTYKPDPRMFQRAFEVVGEWGFKKEEILHVAQSLYHDLVPAQALGLKTIWVDRRAEKPGAGATQPSAAPVKPAWTVPSLAALAALEEKERGAG